MSGATGALLAAFLGAAVPLLLAELRAQGGPGAADWDRARAFGRILGPRGDLLLYRSTKPGETARLANDLAHAIAVLAFVPGGVRVFGQHWVGDAAEVAS